MNKKAFTLIELLAVIALLVIIFILVVPAVNKVINRAKDTTYQKQINTILDAAYDWSLKNTENLPSEGNKTFVTLSDLKFDGFIDSDIKDTKTSEPFPDDLVISITNVGNTYKNKNTYAKKMGAYLYKLEEDSFTHSGAGIYPTIILNELTADSSGNYLEKVNIKGTVLDVKYTATDSNDNDITDRVKVRITKDDKVVTTIDTSKDGIYKMIYTVIDDRGLAKSVIRNIVISDIEPPKLVVPENTTIETTVTTYNLNTGVSCTDNMGVCTISISGEIEFGKAGKYVIEYTAKDSSGNTTTEKRVITVE